MSTKKSSSPMQYRIEVGKDILKKYYRNPDSAYRNYERFCEVYPDLEVCLFDSLHNEIIYRRDGLTEELKEVHNPDNRMKYKVVVEFNNGRVDKYRHFKRYDSADNYYCECLQRGRSEDWSGTVASVKLIDLSSQDVLAFCNFDHEDQKAPFKYKTIDSEGCCKCSDDNNKKVKFFTKFKNFLKECVNNITDKMNLF